MKNIRYIKKRIYESRYLYLLFFLPCVYLVIFKYGAMGWLGIAFKDFNARAGFVQSKWVGWSNFQQFLHDPYFYRILKNTIVLNVWMLIFFFPVPIALALLIDEIPHGRAKKLVQTISYLPYFVSTVVVCSLVIYLFAADGLVNDVMVDFGASRKTYLMDPGWFRPLYVISEIWQNAGWGSIIYLAGLAGINPQLYEAATIDGASRFSQVIHVSIPGIAPIISIQFLLTIGKLLNVGYEKILLLYSGATYKTADVISTYVYRRGLIDADYSYGAAVSIFQAVLALVLVVGANKAAKKIGSTSLW